MLLQGQLMILLVRKGMYSHIFHLCFELNGIKAFLKSHLSLYYVYMLSPKNIECKYLFGSEENILAPLVKHPS